MPPPPTRRSFLGDPDTRARSSRNQRPAPPSASCRSSARAQGPTRPARSPHRPHPAGPCRLTGTQGQLGPRELQGYGLRDPGPIASARAGSQPARPALPTASLAAAHPPGSAPPPPAAAVRRVNIPASPRRGRAAAGPSPRPHPAAEPTPALSRELGCASLA